MQGRGARCVRSFSPLRRCPECKRRGRRTAVRASLPFTTATTHSMEMEKIEIQDDRERDDNRSQPEAEHVTDVMHDNGALEDWFRAAMPVHFAVVQRSCAEGGSHVSAGPAPAGRSFSDNVPRRTAGPHIELCSAPCVALCGIGFSAVPCGGRLPFQSRKAFEHRPAVGGA
jgi:hypothetical protein